MITLIIVDPQYDFIEGGKLPVKGGRKALENVAELIRSGEVGRVIITKDWHPADHSSFTDFGGEFPEHCVQLSHGSMVHSSILKAIKEKSIYRETIHKGKEPGIEEFTAFKNDVITYYDHVAILNTDDDYTLFSYREEVVICGIAGDICVLNTIQALYPYIQLKIFKKGIASLDGGSTLNKFIIDTDIEVYE